MLLLLLMLYLQPETPKVMLQSHKAYESNPDALCAMPTEPSRAAGAVAPRRLETVPQLSLQPETSKVMLQSHKAYESNPDAVCAMQTESGRAAGAVVPRRLETVPQLYLQPETPKVMLLLLLLVLLL